MGWNVQGATSSSLCLDLKIQGWKKKLKWQSLGPLESYMTSFGESDGWRQSCVI